MTIIAIIIGLTVLVLGIYLLLREALAERVCELMAHQRQTIAAHSERLEDLETWQRRHDTAETFVKLADAVREKEAADAADSQSRS